jgi:hypothetical protein
MECAVEMGSDGMIYVPSSMTIGSGIEVTFRYDQYQVSSFTQH